MRKNKIKNIQDADLSSAGDDFHVLWTMKKSFEMLNFDDEGLKAIYIEDVEKKFSTDSDPTGEKFLGIDMSEYYGGKDFNSACKIIISQLKYSTRRADETYTFSKLYKGKKSDSYNGSIIHRLSSIFKTFIDEFGREKVLRKVQIKLVSNRDIDKNQLSILNSIKVFLNSNKRRVSFNKILDKNFIKYRKSLMNLQTASKLNLTEFTDFLRILDFDDCGANSRNLLKLNLVKAISNTAITYKSQYNALYLVVWNKCMPESDGNRIITATDIIANLGFDGGLVENLFPVKQNFIAVKNQVKREQLEDILKVLTNKDGNMVCLHGGAGIGKSTIVQQIKDNIPKHSECIIFDCYGKGAYQYSTDRRHKPKYGLIHIANELAKLVGSSFLLNRGESNDVYIIEFEKRLKEGIQILKNRNEGSVLNIIIDAADNSIVASKIHNEISFISQLVNFKVPSGCNIILTTRTYRKDSLNLPDDYIDIPLEPFSKNETRQFVGGYYENIDDNQVDDFHSYTDGIPRAQFYALDLKLKGIDEIINYLKPNGKKVEDFILDKIKDAERRIGNKDKHLIKEFLTLLITLPRPVPIDYLAEIMNVTVSFLSDLKSELWTGLICENEQFEFRDEDFENFIREEYSFNDIELSKIADVFLNKSETDFYAAKSLGFILYNAGKYEDLKEIVLGRYNLESITDPVREKEIYIERVKQAIKLSRNENDYVTLYKLILIAAEEAKTDKTLSDLLISHPELILSFGDEYSLQKYKLNSEETSWGGSFHLKLASTYSRVNKDVALRHLNTAEDWLNWRRNNKERLDKDFNNNYNISSLDISCQTEAVLRIFGVERCVKSLFRWTPEYIRLLAGENLIENIFQFSTTEQINVWLRSSRNLRLDIKIFLVTKLFKHKRDTHFDLDALTDSFLRCKRINFDIRFHSVLVDFCEILFNKNIDVHKVLNILSFINYSVPQNIPYFRNQFDDGIDEFTMDIALRMKFIQSIINNKSISLDSIYPEKFKNIEEIEDYEKRNHVSRDKQEFDNFYSINLSVYKLRTELFLKSKERDNLISEFKELCKKIAGNYDYDYRAGYRSQEQKLFFVKKMTELCCFINDKSLIDDIINSDTKVPYTGLRFTVLNETQILRSFDNKNLKLLNEIDKKFDEINGTSQELVDDYIKCTTISSKIDNNVGKYFFEKSLEAVKEIEYYEAFSKIGCLYNLTSVGVEKSNAELAYKYARFVEYCDVSLDGYEKKHFPYEIALRGISNLDFTSLYSTICRWHHRDVIDIHSYTLILLDKSFKSKFINHEEALSLMPLYQLDHHSDTLIQLYRSILGEFDKNSDVNGKTDFVKYLLRRYKLVNDRSILKDIYENIKSGSFIEHNVLEELEDYLSFLDILNKEKKEEYKSDNSKQEYHYDINIEDIDIISNTELESVIEKISLNDESFGRWKVDKFLSDVMDRVEVGQFADHLNALVRIDSKILNYYSLEKALSERLNEWSYHPIVNNWFDESFKHVLSSWFYHFSEHKRLSIWSINKLAELFKIDRYKLADAIIEIIPDKIDELSDESLYDVFELIKLKLSKKQNEELLHWALDRWSLKIKENVADGSWSEVLVPSKNKDEVLSDLLRFVLGHPNKKNRWRAIHSIKKIVHYNINILKYLLEKQDLDHCFPFQNKDYKFYWISAKLYLWIAIEKVSIEYPDIIVPYKSYLLSEIRNTELPHVLIKYFVKKTCFNILEKFPNSFNSDEIQTINDCLQSKFEKVNEERLSRKQRKYNSNKSKKWRFKFDTMDTLPYWYSGLGQIFNLSEYDVADLADKYIVEKWGFVGDIDEYDFITNQLSSREWSLTSKRHGSNPQVETLEVYLEYHGMFCAAGDLLDMEPQVEDESYWRTWDTWLKSRANTWDKFWISDLVDSIPLQEKYWKIEYPKFDKDWRDSIEEDKFDREIGLLDFYNENFIVPHSYNKRYMRGNTESVYIRSALVSKKGSEALLRAFQSAKNHHDYAFPIEKDSDKNEIDKLGFKYYSWIKYNESDAEGKGLDKHDFLYEDIGYSIPCIGSEITELFGIQYSEDLKRGFLSERLIMKSINWNNTTNERYRSSGLLESEGEVLEVDFDFILKVLQKTNRNMIIKCQIERQLQKREYDYKDDKRSWEHIKLYLLKSDGTVKTLRGRNFKIG